MSQQGQDEATDHGASARVLRIKGNADKKNRPPRGQPVGVESQGRHALRQLMSTRGVVRLASKLGKRGRTSRGEERGVLSARPALINLIE